MPKHQTLSPDSYQHKMLDQPRLTREEEIELAEKIIKGRKSQGLLTEKQRPRQLSLTEKKKLEAAVRDGQDAKEKFAAANLRLVVWMVRKIVRECDAPYFDDLISEGNQGLIIAINRFDPARNVRFSTYATWWIRRYITTALEDQTATVRIPRSARRMIPGYLAVKRELAEKLQQTPSQEEMAEAMNTPVRTIKLIERAMAITLPMQILAQEQHEDEAYCLKDDITPSAPKNLEHRLSEEAVEFLISLLEKRDREVIILRYGLRGQEKHTLEELGQRFGVTRERVRQIEQRALTKLRSYSRIGMFEP